MKVVKALLVASISGSIVASGLLSTAFATEAKIEPKGAITKTVQNQTTNGKVIDADSAATALNAKTGDILKYTIEIKNIAEASTGDNDLYATTLTDTLPAGVELVTDPTKRGISEDLNIIKAGGSTIKTYTVKVTAKQGQTIENKACFTGNNKANNGAQNGCNSAFIIVGASEAPQVPAAPITPAPNVPKEQTPVPATPQQIPTPTVPAATTKPLPTTGPASWLAAPLAALYAGLFVYAARMYMLKRSRLI